MILHERSVYITFFSGWKSLNDWCMKITLNGLDTFDLAMTLAHSDGTNTLEGFFFRSLVRNFCSTSVKNFPKIRSRNVSIFQLLFWSTHLSDHTTSFLFGLVWGDGTLEISGVPLLVTIATLLCLPPPYYYEHSCMLKTAFGGQTGTKKHLL